MSDKKKEQKQTVPGVSEDLLNGFLNLLTLRFIRDDRADREREAEEKRNG